MPTHSQLAAQLLRDAAAFFETIGQQNEPLREQMMENAAVFSEVAMLVETDPLGIINAHIHSPSSHEGGCCGGAHHHHEEEVCEDKGKKEGCDGNGGCGCN
jgi:hypothetical protein